MNTLHKLVGLALNMTLAYWSATIRSLARMLIIAALVGGCLLMLFFGGRSPEWMLKGEVLIVSIFALVYGFTAFSPSLPSWLKYQEVRGVTLVAMGVAAMFIPAQFLVSSLLIGFGARLVMTSDLPMVGVRGGGKPIGRGDAEIVLRQKGGVVRR